MSLLHIPVDFQLRSGVRLLATKLPTSPPEDPARQAVLYAFLLWCDYGRAGTDWRPLNRPWREEGYDWSTDDLAGLLEDYVGWRGSRGEFVRAALAADLLRLQPREEIFGLLLTEFADFNPHLLPGHRSMQSKGGKARALKLHARQLSSAAEQQERVLFEQGRLIFTEPQPPSREETRGALLLVMKIDAAAGRSLRSAGEYVKEQAMMSEALRRVRQFLPEEIELVINFLNESRENPTISKDAEVVLRDFPELLKLARL